MNILLTGRPGCGKSTLVQALLEGLQGKRIAGIITPEIRNQGRTGFKIRDLASREEEILASVHIKTQPRVGKYGINLQGIDKIVDAFLLSFATAEYIFLDEIGKMELFSAKFREVCQKILASNKLVVAVVHRNLVDQYKGKGEVIWVEREKMQEIKSYLFHILAKAKET